MSLWLDSRLSVVDVPSRDGALGVIGDSGMAYLIKAIVLKGDWDKVLITSRKVSNKKGGK